MKRIIIAIIGMLVSMTLYSQDFSDDVSLADEGNGSVTLNATAAASKKKDAQTLAVQSAFNALFHSGIEGVKNGVPMVAQKHSDYDYRFFSESRYLNYVTGEIKNVEDKKVGGMVRSTVTVTIRYKSLIADLQRNNIALNPGWSDSKKVNATAALNPTIVVVPYVKGDDDDFEAMRRLVDSRPVVKHAISELTSSFGKNGYKTKNFITLLQNTKTSEAMRMDTQSDEKTKIVQMLPGDIVVMVDVTVKTDANKYSECSLSVDAVEKQTGGNLSNASFSSGKYITTDTIKLANYAMKKIQEDFFTGLKSAFETMISKGREISIEMTLSTAVNEWDFDQPSPSTNEDFKEAMDEWLREHSFQGVYDMSISTDKYVQASLNIPLWDEAQGRSYSLSNFGKDFKQFLRSQFGDMYKANVTSMGQKLVVNIE